jgi:hypothetical protein
VKIFFNAEARRERKTRIEDRGWRRDGYFSDGWNEPPSLQIPSFSEW